MQHSGIRQVSRTLLTITGIVLLIVFGVRAASQASDLAAVGGQAKRATLSLPLSRSLAFLQTQSDRAAFSRLATTSTQPASPSLSTSSPTTGSTLVRAIYNKADNTIVALNQSVQGVAQNSVSSSVSDAQHLIHHTSPQQFSEPSNGPSDN